VVSKPATTVAAAGVGGCYGNMSSSSSSSVTFISPLSQDLRSRLDVKQPGGMTSSRGGHSRPRHVDSNQPGYMQMTRAASVR